MEQGTGEGTRRAVVLLSGGLDSTTCAYLAKSEGFEVLALSFDYGQRLRRELESAKKVAAATGASEHVIMTFDLRRFGASALTSDFPVPQHRTMEEIGEGIPATYVPARNTVLLAFGLSFAEAREAEALFIGVNALDSSGYPDCRPEFISAFQEVAGLGTRVGAMGRPVRIVTPLIALTKAEIVKLGVAAGVDHGLTWSCYVGGDRPCGACDSCLLRAKGFEEAGVPDPLLATR